MSSGWHSICYTLAGGGGGCLADDGTHYRVESEVELREVVRSYYEICALDVASRASCWSIASDLEVPGASRRARGARGTIARSPPRLELPDVASLVATDTYVCAVLSGDLYCWSFQIDVIDESGRLESPLMHPARGFISPSPTRQTTFGDVETVVASALYTCALTEEGSIWCRGGPYGYSGAPAFPESALVVLPQPATTLQTAGQDTFCAETRDGSIYCWGARVGALFETDVDTVRAPEFLTAHRVQGMAGTYASVSDLACALVGESIRCTSAATVPERCPGDLERPRITGLPLATEVRPGLPDASCDGSRR